MSLNFFSMQFTIQKKSGYVITVLVMLILGSFKPQENSEKEKANQKIEIVEQKTKLPLIVASIEGKENPIHLNNLKITTKVIGKVAVTTMDMVFYNSYHSVLSGELNFPLNEGQTISKFSLEVNGKMREAVVVEKAKGRKVYERIVRRGVDPGLVELTKGNVFKTRIYPLMAKSTKRVIVSYEQELVSDQENTYYQLPLFFNEKVQNFSLNMEVEADSEPVIEKGGIENFQFTHWENVFKASFKSKNFTAQQSLILKVPKSSSIHLMTQKAVNGDHYFFSTIYPEIKSKAKKEISSLCLLWDVSNSSKSRDVEKEIEVVDSYLQTIKDAKIRLITFSNAVVEDLVFDNREALLNKLKTLDYDGGTQLSSIPFSSIQEEEAILVSDGIHTFGEEHLQTFKVPIHVLNSTVGSDYAILRYIALRSGGQFLHVSTTATGDLVKQLSTLSYQFISSEVIEGEVVEIYPQIKQKVTMDFSWVGIVKSPKASVKLNFGFGNEIQYSKTIEIDPNESYQNHWIPSRMWAEKKIAEMNIQYEENKEEITALGKAYSIVTKNTSLIVLENVMDYVENEIIPPQELKEQYDRIVNQKNRNVTSVQENKMKNVLRNWEARVNWWNQEIETLPTIKKYDWSETAESNAEVLEVMDAEVTVEEVEELDDLIELMEIDQGNQNLEEVVVRAERIIEVDKTSTGAEISAEEIRNVAVRRVNTLNSSTVNVDDGGFLNVGGNRSENNLVIVNGVKMNTNTSNLPVSAIRDLQVITGGVPAQYENADAMQTHNRSNSSVRRNRTTVSNSSKTNIRQWTPNTSVFTQLDSVEANKCYQKYLTLKLENKQGATFYTDAARVLFKKERKDEALRVLSNLGEIDYENHELLKVMGNNLLEWKEYPLAVYVFEEILKQREEEPQSYRDLGLALHYAGRDQEAIEILYRVIEKDWDSRFPEIENIVLAEINHIIAKSEKKLQTNFMHKKLKDHLPTDIRVVIDWDADMVDIDLWVVDPRGEKCYFKHRDTKIGGHISRDFTRGYGPEEFILKKAIKGEYKVLIKYYGNSRQRIAGPPTVKANLTTNFGKENEQYEELTVRLEQTNDIIQIGKIKIE